MLDDGGHFRPDSAPKLEDSERCTASEALGNAGGSTHLTAASTQSHSFQRNLGFFGTGAW